MLHARRLAGRFHRGQQVPVAQVLACLGGEHIGSAGDCLCFQVPDHLNSRAVERDRPLAGRRLGGVLTPNPVPFGLLKAASDQNQGDHHSRFA